MKEERMVKQAMIYERAVPVSNERHMDLSVQIGEDYGFAAHLNAVPILIAEFDAVALEYPIIFTESNGTVAPAAMLGLRNDENLFVSPDGRWNAKYIPAFIRRYPFIFAHKDESDQFILCIDEAFDGCNRGGGGAALFRSFGEPSEYLRGMLDFTTTYQREFQVTQRFCERLSAVDILSPAQVKFQFDDGAKAATRGLWSVDRERLKALTKEELGDLAKSDDLEKIYAHLVSLKNMAKLGEILNAKSTGGTPNL